MCVPLYSVNVIVILLTVVKISQIYRGSILIWPPCIIKRFISAYSGSGNWRYSNVAYHGMQPPPPLGGRIMCYSPSVRTRR